MRKLVKLITVTTIVTTASLQVTACKDDSKYNSFISEVNQSKNNKTAFFGFLGTADDETSSALQVSFDLFNQKEANDKTRWQNWIDNEASSYLKEKGLSNIFLHYYQGPYHQDKSSDIIDSFWNQKNVTWQKNIFNWVYNNTKNNSQFKKPHGVEAVKEINPKKDGDNKDMFAKLPIVFIVSKGNLITAGEEWISANSSINQQEDAIKDFILANLFLPDDK
ncbi:MAG: hypothetical protein ACRC8P_00560 [Spiroplasma sp.]